MRIRLLAPAALGLAAGALAGCAPATTPAVPAGSAPDYADGEYTADGEYVAPSGPESVTVTLAVSDGTVTEVLVVGDATDPTAQRYQGEFIDGIGELVVGRPLAELDLSRVAGSSLTSAGFNQALERIRAEAQR